MKGTIKKPGRLHRDIRSPLAEKAGGLHFGLRRINDCGINRIFTTKAK